jgi:predicted GNAT family acetyltransferase
MADVTHKPETTRFVSDDAFLTYVRAEDTFDIQHTVVPRELEGQGIGSALVRAAVEHARSEGLTIVPSCSFARKWLARHPAA